MLARLSELQDLNYTESSKSRYAFWRFVFFKKITILGYLRPIKSVKLKKIFQNNPILSAFYSYI